MFCPDSPISRHVDERHHAPRQRRSRTGSPRRTDACIEGDARRKFLDDPVDLDTRTLARARR